MIGLPNPRVLEGMWVSLFFLWNTITRTFDSHIHAYMHMCINGNVHTHKRQDPYSWGIYVFSMYLFLLSSKCVLQCRAATFLLSFCFVSMLVVSVLCGVSFVVSVVDSVLFFSLCVCVGVCSVAAHSSRSDSKDDLISFLFLSCSHRDLYFCVSVFTTKITVIWMRWVLKFSNLWWCCCLLFFGVCLRWGVQDRGTLLARGLRRWLYCLELRHYDYASYGMGVCCKSRPKEAVHRRV